jgi:hypothetical protein
VRHNPHPASPPDLPPGDGVTDPMSFMRSLLALCALSLCSLAGHAQTTPAVSSIVAFSLSNAVGNVVRGPDGALYGAAVPVTSVAGGIIWRSTVDGSDVRTLYQLTPNDAVTPGGGLTLASDGLLYGMTRFGKSPAACIALRRMAPAFRSSSASPRRQVRTSS